MIKDVRRYDRPERIQTVLRIICSFSKVVLKVRLFRFPLRPANVLISRVLPCADLKQRGLFSSFCGVTIVGPTILNILVYFKIFKVLVSNAPKMDIFGNLKKL